MVKAHRKVKAACACIEGCAQIQSRNGSCGILDFAALCRLPFSFSARFDFTGLTCCSFFLRGPFGAPRGLMSKLSISLIYADCVTPRPITR